MASERSLPSTLTRREATAALAGVAAAAGLGCTPKDGAAPSSDSGGATKATSSRRMPTAFIPHGGGPWPILSLPMMPADETKALAAYMRTIAEVPGHDRPRALVVISAHWEETKVTINTGAKPALHFDYSGFPSEAYELTWPAPGDPEVAGRVEDLLRAGGLPTATNANRGYDHGTFVPLILAYPKADVPVVQVSLKRGLDPAEHLAMGRALAPLRDEGVYILGSGNSFHNLRALFGRDASSAEASRAFDAWLEQAVTGPAGEREAALARWSEAPGAGLSHPREEHLIPLMVAAGAAGDDAGRVAWRGTMASMALSAHHFG